MTTQEIIKILPLEQAFKTELLENWDTLTPDQKFNIEQKMWDAYFAIYQLRLQENIQKAMLKAEKGEASLDKDFYARVRKQTEEEIKTEAVSEKETVDLSAARTAMEKIIKEIKASKKITLPRADEL